MAGNIAAIRLARELDNEHRMADADEQAILADYVGWGGIAEVFDARHPEYAEQRAQLHELLTPGEYERARISTLTSFYTPQNASRVLYDALDAFGFAGGDILEPSCGIGSLIAAMPAEMRASSDVYGVELDDVSAEIAKQLQQSAHILNSGIETASFADGSFDAVVGNVPFGNYGVYDPTLPDADFQIHDYFFAKAIQKARPGGMIALITSAGTLDKQDARAREYMDRHARFLGAIRLPNNTFSGDAGTEVTTDIVFLMKRDGALEESHGAWTRTRALELGDGDASLQVGEWFAEHPECVLGNLVAVSGPYGPQLACLPDGRDIGEASRHAIRSIMDANPGIGYRPSEGKPRPWDAEEADIAANVPEDTVFIRDGAAYVRRNGRTRDLALKGKGIERAAGLIRLRDVAVQLNDAQRLDDDDARSDALRGELNRLYDEQVRKYGYLNSKDSAKAFSEDARYPLLTSLEVAANDGTGGYLKADIFYRRTMRPAKVVEHVDTAQEALVACIGEKGGVDIGYMEDLTGLDAEKLLSDLGPAIFMDPETAGWEEPRYVTADEYLSGDVREKLDAARQLVGEHPELAANVAALEAVQPETIPADQISATLGSAWIPARYVEQFVYHLLSTPYSYQRDGYGWGDKITVDYARETGRWNITKKGSCPSVLSTETYGTSHMNAYEIIEATLNLNPIRIMKSTFVFENGDWAERKVVDREATANVLAKQEVIRQKFREWLFDEPARRNTLVGLYNRLFNSNVLRRYDGDSLVFHGMASDIRLRKHQLDAVARILHGGNTLLGHCVGAGKTFEMVAAAQESKYLGLCSKSLFVVPNHLTAQWGSEYLRLYPDAKVLVTTKRDFEKANRAKFVARMATGDWDAIIMGHSQFEKIPLSDERQLAFLEEEYDAIMKAWERAKLEEGDGFTVKQYARKKESVRVRLERLRDKVEEGKDSGITFEELGVDRLFVDEAHEYKNLEFTTKMSRVAGVNSQGSLKAYDLYMKTRYLNGLTGERGIIFATGTPISNSIVEMFNMQRYLQPTQMAKSQVATFDEWASSFTEQVSAIEINPTGTGFRNNTRLAKYNNIPELMSMFNAVADIKTADDLDLPTPTAIYHNVTVDPSEVQRKMVSDLGDRADMIHGKRVAPDVDNMLKVTNEGRLLALDARAVDPTAPDTSLKIAACADNVARIWRDNANIRATQIVFCDIATPSAATELGAFSAYDDLKDRLVERGVPAEEIAFIHDAKTDSQKEKLFEKVRSGQVRVLIGSTAKMGTGTNVQDRLIATHDLDCPWRPSDLEQRAGRTIRQGNENEEVGVYRYVTKGTFDSYLYQMVERKQRFISQIMSGRIAARTVDDIDTSALQYAEIKAAATGDPRIREKLELDNRLAQLELERAGRQQGCERMLELVCTTGPARKAALDAQIAGYRQDAATRDAYKTLYDGGTFTVLGKPYMDPKEASEALKKAFHEMTASGLDDTELGSYRGFTVYGSVDRRMRAAKLVLKGAAAHELAVREIGPAVVSRLDNILLILEDDIVRMEERKASLEADMQEATAAIDRPWGKEEEYKELRSRCVELSYLLGFDDTPPGQELVEESETVDALEADKYTARQLAIIRKAIRENKMREQGEKLNLDLLFSSKDAHDDQYEVAFEAMMANEPEDYCKWLLSENISGWGAAGSVYHATRDSDLSVEELSEIYGKSNSWWRSQGVAFTADWDRISTLTDVIKAGKGVLDAQTIIQIVKVPSAQRQHRRWMAERAAEGKDISAYMRYGRQIADEYYNAYDEGIDLSALLEAGAGEDLLAMVRRVAESGYEAEKAIEIGEMCLGKHASFIDLITRCIQHDVPLDGVEKYLGMTSYNQLRDAFLEMRDGPQPPDGGGIPTPGGYPSANRSNGPRL